MKIERIDHVSLEEHGVRPETITELGEKGIIQPA